MFTRLYIDISKSAITEQYSTYLLSYLKLRIYTSEKRSYGQVKVCNIPNILGLSQSTTRSHIKFLSDKGYILEKGLSIEVRSPKNLSSKKSLRYVLVPSETIKSFSWKNIAQFRALLAEIVKQEFETKKNALIKGFTVRDKHGYKVKVQDLKLTEFKELAALTLSARLSNISVRTEQRYRSLQTVSTYSTRKVFINGNATNPRKLDYIKWLADNRKGRFIEHNDKLFFCEISRRKSELVVKKVKIA